MPRKPRVLLILHELSITGAPKIALQAMEAARDTFELRILVINGGPLEGRCRRLASTRILWGGEKRGRWSRWIERLPHGLVLRLRGVQLSFSPWLRSFRPDVIYVNSVVSLHAARYVCLPRAPVLLHVHELDSFLRPVASRIGWRLRDWPSSIVAVSHAVAEALTQRFEVTPSKIHVVHEFIDLPPSFQLPKDRETAKIPVIGGAGTVGDRKGTDLWLQMGAELLRLKGKGAVRLVWVGWADNEEGRQMKELASSLGIAGEVEWVPITPDPWPHFTQMDVFALTSREDPCPLVVLEMLALRIPVACFASGGGAPEEIGDAGILIAELDPAQMAGQIAALLDDEPRRTALAAMARPRVEANFSTAVQAPKITALLQEQIGTARRPH